MRTFFIALAILAPAAAASAAERVSDAAFLQASRCAAYSGVDGDAVSAIVSREAVGRQDLVRTRAETEAGQIVRKVRAAMTGAARAA
ncbi:MAG: hypothetical protein EBZ50_05585, partial [Alphaproteobacteria bacterium]|nr:hypothetical protein [Alphaproteobacteria bacterium]